MPRAEQARDWEIPKGGHPDFTLPTDVANEVGEILKTEFAQNDEFVMEKSHPQESETGGFMNLWFEDDDEGQAQQQLFTAALNRWEKRHEDEIHYFLMDYDDSQRALHLLRDQFADIGGSPRYGGA